MVCIGVVMFFGMFDDVDVVCVVWQVGVEVVSLWYVDVDFKGVDVVVVFGGFFYGDYFWVGVIVRFVLVMDEVVVVVDCGMLVLGICNGFQVLCEVGLLFGVLICNVGLYFICWDVWLWVVLMLMVWILCFEFDVDLLVLLKFGEGCYVVLEKVFDELEGEGWVVFCYYDNVNGLLCDIVGICLVNGCVVGLMLYFEYVIEVLIGLFDDGLGLFYLVLDVVLMG